MVNKETWTHSYNHLERNLGDSFNEFGKGFILRVQEKTHACQHLDFGTRTSHLQNCEAINEYYLLNEFNLWYFLM